MIQRHSEVCKDETLWDWVFPTRAERPNEVQWFIDNHYDLQDISVSTHYFREKCLWSFCNKRADCDVAAPFYSIKFWINNQQYLYLIVFAVYGSYLFSLLGILGVVCRNLVCLQLYTIIAFAIFLLTLNECISNIYAAYLINSGGYGRADMTPPKANNILFFFI